MSARTTRLLLVGGGIAAAAVLFLVLRPSDEDDAAATTATITAPADTTTNPSTVTVEQPTTTETQPEPAETVPAEPQVLRFTVAIAGGGVTGGIQRWSVTQGDRVRIVARSDVDDELHLHGYDLTKQVGPGRPAIFAFPATLAGRFELEAHHGGGQIAQLDVQP